MRNVALIQSCEKNTEIIILCDRKKVVTSIFSGGTALGVRILSEVPVPSSLFPVEIHHEVWNGSKVPPLSIPENLDSEGRSWCVCCILPSWLDCLDRCKSFRLQMPKWAQRLSRWSNRRVKFSSKARKPFWTKRIVHTNWFRTAGIYNIRSLQGIHLFLCFRGIFWWWSWNFTWIW